MNANSTRAADVRLQGPAATPRPGATRDTQGAERPEGSFSQAWTEARAAMATRPMAEIVVARGDTLTGIVRESLRQQEGVLPEAGRVLAVARRVAEANGITNPNRIYPGQRITIGASMVATDRATATPAEPPRMGTVTDRPAAAVAAAGVNAANTTNTTNTTTTSAASTAQNLRAREAAQGNPVLERTLQRAVERRFISAAERPAVERRILALSRQFGFSPDDFARVALMESDGLNPRASNGRCYGIIQFCEGAQRGAGSVGMAGRAQSITSMSVLRQLDLVERYFRDTGLDRMDGPVSLDDLYLTVLTPAARATRDPGEALNVPGKQAAMLYTGGDRRAPITRSSLLEGLRRNADYRLSEAAVQPLSRPSGRRQDLAAAIGQSSPLAPALSGSLRPSVQSLTPGEPPV